MPQQTNTPQKHKVRTFFASVFGVAAVWLILSSILFIWLNRTLTNTETFTNTITPALKTPAVQQFVTNKVSEVLIHSVPVEDAARALLPADQVAGKTPEQLMTELQPVISKNVEQVLLSPAFTNQWQNALTSSHEQFIKQLENGSGTLSLDLNPLLTEAVNGLKTTQLAPLTTGMTVTPEIGKIHIKDGPLIHLNRSYKLFKAGMVVVIILALITIVLSIALSVHHLKTVRFILFGVGVSTLLMAALLQIPSTVKLGDNMEAREVAVVITKALSHDLQLAYLVIGIVSMASGLGILLFQRLKNKQ